MELDKRILEGKKPLTCFDTEQAKEFLGKECYFSNCKVHYKNLSAFEKFAILTDYCIGTLTAIIDLGDRVFDVDQQSKEFRYCLPCEWVKEPEKKYRAFTNEEFLTLFDSGKLHSIRRKNEQGRYIITDVYFNDEYEKGTIFVKLNSGGIGLAMRFLVNNGYEYFDGKDWKPFGVEENESAK